jgi:hypothetical protein
MSKRCPDRQGFIAALLEPRPKDELVDPELGILARKACRENWRRSMQYVLRAEAARHLACFNLNIDRLEGGANEQTLLPIIHATQATYMRLIYKQMRVPAPNIDAVKWKRANIKGAKLLGSEDYAKEMKLREALIAKDEAAIGARKVLGTGSA